MPGTENDSATAFDTASFDQLQVTHQETALAAETDAAPDPAAASASIKIGDKIFTDQQEAWNYAEEIEKERVAQDAYLNGLRDGQVQPQVQGNQQQVTQQPEDDFDEKFYADPKKFLQERDSQIEQRLEQKLEAKNAQKAKETTMWDAFYKKNPDLKNASDLVQVTLTRDWDVLGNMKDSKKALDLLAASVRGKINDMVQDSKPKVDLEDTRIINPAGDQAVVTTKVAEEKDLDFMSQVRQFQKGKLN